MTFARQAAEDFEHARRKSCWRDLTARLLGRDNALLPFDQTRRLLRAQAQHHGGLRPVPIAQIVGSENRYHDFDSAFLPRRTSTRGRWQSIDRAHYDGTPLPPIELYRLGETYFVKDGNHRVSVARERGQEFIDAVVLELQVPVSIASVAELHAWLRRQDAVAFLARTRLRELRPDGGIELTLPGQYATLLEHIEVHRWFLGVERTSPIPWEAGVASWYDTVYAPVVATIRTSGVLRDFPGRTEADLYLWIVEHCWYRQRAGDVDDEAPLEVVVRDYADAFSPRPSRRVARFARRVRTRLRAA